MSDREAPDWSIDIKYVDDCEPEHPGEQSDGCEKPTVAANSNSFGTVTYAPPHGSSLVEGTYEYDKAKLCAMLRAAQIIIADNMPPSDMGDAIYDALTTFVIDINRAADGDAPFNSMCMFYHDNTWSLGRYIGNGSVEVVNFEKKHVAFFYDAEHIIPLHIFICAEPTHWNGTEYDYGTEGGAPTRAKKTTNENE